MKNLYVLLVGINDYHPSVGKLNGCISDLDNIESMLFDYYMMDYNVSVYRLQDQEATYQNIIDGFRNHLRLAGPEDIVWFHYSGHGSEEYTAAEFWPIEPKGKDQTLVCYDSGFGAQNLADKELAVLLHEVATQYPDNSQKDEPHIVVTLDCCHSGSGTRSAEEVKPRNTSSRHSGYRDFNSYVDGFYARQDRLYVPLSRHIVLSACENIQFAGDIPEGGIFTNGLMDALRSNETQIDYVDLFRQVRSQVRSRRKDQNPQFNSIGSFDPYTKFLSGERFGFPERYEITEKAGKWFVECGAIHGLQSGSPIEFDIYTPPPSNEFKGGAQLKSIGALRSQIDLDTNIDISNIFKSITSNTTDYRAELKYLPAPPENVYLSGDGELVKLLKDSWDNSQNVVAVDEMNDDVTISVCADDSGFEITDLQLNKPAYKSQGTGDAAVGAVIKALGKIVKWRRFIALENSDRRSKLANDLDFSVEITSESYPDTGSTHSAPEIKLYANKENSDTLDGDPHFFLFIPKITVRGNHEKLYFYTFFLDENYAIEHPEESKNYRLDERPDVPEYQQALWNDFYFGPEPYNSHETCWVKLLVTTEELDYSKFEQEGIDPEGAHRGGRRRGAEVYDDWAAFTMQVTVAKDEGRIPKDRSARVQDTRLSIEPNGNVDAKVSIASTNQVSRGSDPAQMFERMQTSEFALIDFSKSGSHRENVIELREIQGTDTLVSNPLEIIIEGDSSDDVLPIVFDGSMFRVAGDASVEGGETKVHVRQLHFEAPDTSEEGMVQSPFDTAMQDRSLFSAAKLAFFKVALKKKDVNTLHLVQRNGIDINLTTDNITSAVSEANSVCILLHGLAGDAKAMSEALYDSVPKWMQEFDVILAYDFENLNTPLEETATQLKEALLSAGIPMDRSKQVTVVGHSVGGLLARWFVEWTGGNQMVTRCVLIGTPNEGSLYGKLEDFRSYASTGLDLAINFIPNIVPFSGYVLKVLKGLGELTGTLAQMTPGSELLTRLDSSPDPGCDYVLISGDHTASEGHSGPFAFLADNLGKISGESGGHDLFASVKSTASDAFASSWSSEVKKVSGLPCHHYNYFSYLTKELLT